MGQGVTAHRETKASWSHLLGLLASLIYKSRYGHLRLLAQTREVIKAWWVLMTWGKNLHKNFSLITNELPEAHQKSTSPAHTMFSPQDLVIPFTRQLWYGLFKSLVNTHMVNLS
jgi:hypothetical protein